MTKPPKFILDQHGRVSDTGTQIIPGSMQPPPFVVPYCRFCELPAERYVIEPPTSPYRLGIDAFCCGQHQGAWVSHEEVLRIKQTNDKLWLVNRRGQYKSIGELRRYGAGKK